MSTTGTNKTQMAWYLLAALLVGNACGGAAIWFLSRHGRSDDQQPVAEAPRDQPVATLELVEGQPYTISVPDTVKRALGIGEPSTARLPTRERQLTLQGGTTAFDPTRTFRVRTQFSARVIELRQVNEPPRVPGSTFSSMREIRAGDPVHKDDVLAVVWSVEVGGKKSDLVDALVQLGLDDQRLKAREKLFLEGGYPEDNLNQTKRDVIVDRNAVDRAERTLRTWNIPDREIQAVHEEAKEILKRKGERDKEKERQWARCELLAPQDGTLVERNVNVQEFVVDNTQNLFTITDLGRLWVIAQAPEDDVAALRGLPVDRRRWTLRLIGAPPIDAAFDDISYLLDPNQHTAPVKGYIDNPGGRLSGGQFVSATINLPAPPDVVEVPLTALAEDGKQSFVFVQPDPQRPYFTLRRVQVAQRFDSLAYVRSRLSPEEERLTADEEAQGMQPRRPLRPGDRILTSGALELRAALEDKLQTSGRRQ
jgi:cobalt-zinc-cadmium efflux system membrane fusion protein